LAKADGSVIRKLVYLPVQSDITTIIFILASAARLASTLWVIGIDLRCVFLFMERGGVPFDGLKSMIGGSLPGTFVYFEKSNVQTTWYRLSSIPAEEKFYPFRSAPTCYSSVGFYLFCRLRISYLETRLQIFARAVYQNSTVSTW
jgi:hypothetical protein